MPSQEKLISPSNPLPQQQPTPSTLFLDLPLQWNLLILNTHILLAMMALIWLPILMLSPFQVYFHPPDEHQYPPFFFGMYMACSITVTIPMLYGELYEAYDRWQGLGDEREGWERTWKIRVIEFLRTRAGRVVIGAMFARKALWTFRDLLHKGPYEMGFTVGMYIFLLFFVAKRY